MEFVTKFINLMLLTALFLIISACAAVPRDLDSQYQDDGNNFERWVVASQSSEFFRGYFSSNSLKASSTEFLNKASFVAGDVLRLHIGGMEQFDGLYKVTAQGTIDLPFARSFSVTHLSRNSLIDSIENELVRLNWFYKQSVRVELSLVRLAPVSVSVFGAVFNPGQITINSRPITKPEAPIGHTSGAFAVDRNLISALIGAGGIRPDADISKVYLKRDNTIFEFDLSSLLDGRGFAEIPLLVNGDQIFASSTGLVNRSLIKPSQVTPPGMRIFMSNLTAPALNNAQAAVGVDSTRMPYGSSLLDSVISANCVGGTHQANASRSVVLITRNHGSSQQLVVRRSINQLLANSSNTLVNPFMMPNDSIACYDSRFTNFRDVAQGISEVISPFLLGRLL